MPAFPNIPYNPTQTVEPQIGMPEDYLRVQANPKAFGEQVGAAKEELGKTQEQIGQETAQLGLSYQQLNNQITANTLTTQYADWAGQQALDFRTKYNGQNAAAQLPVFQKGLQEKLQQTAAGIPSLPARVAFLQDARSFYDRATYNIGSYVGDEVKRTNIESWKGRINTQINQATLSASINPDDTSWANESINKIIDSTRVIANQMGINDTDAINAQIADNVGELFNRVTTEIMSHGTTAAEQYDSLQKASDFLNKYRTEALPDHPDLPLLDAKTIDLLDNKIKNQYFLIQGRLDREDAKNSVQIRTAVTNHLSNAQTLIETGHYDFDDKNIPTDDQIDAAYKTNPEEAEIRKSEAHDLLDFKHTLFQIKDMTPEQLEKYKGSLVVNPNDNIEDAGRRARLSNMVDRLIDKKVNQSEADEIRRLGYNKDQILAKLPNLTDEEAQGLADYYTPRAGDTDKIIDAKIRMQGILDRAITERGKKLQEDSAQYVMQGDKELTGLYQSALKDPTTIGHYIQSSTVKQELLGVPEDQVHVLPRIGAQKFVQSLEADPNTMNDKINQLRQQTGVYWPQVYRDLVTYGKLSPQTQAIGMLDPKNAQILTDIISLTKKGDRDINDLLPKTTGETNPYTKIKQGVSSNPWVQQFTLSLHDSLFTLDEVAGVQDSISTLAAGIMYNSKTSNYQDAITKAVQAFQATTEFVGTARVPAKYFSTVSNNALQTLAGMSLNNIQVPTKITDRLKTDPHSVTPDEWLTQIKNNPHWVTSPDNTSMRLLGPDGTFVRDKKGNPIELKFNATEMPKNPPPVIGNPFNNPNLIGAF